MTDTDEMPTTAPIRSLLETVRSALDPSSGPFQDQFPGGYWFGDTEGDPDMPYLVVSVGPQGPSGYEAGSDTVSERTTLLFHGYGTDNAALTDALFWVASELEKAEPDTLKWSGGEFGIRGLWADAMTIEEDPDRLKGGSRVYHGVQSVEFEWDHKRS